MQFAPLDYCAFIGYIVVVVAFAMYMSRREESSEDYFLAGRKLTWWLIGISLIASNISTEHFVGMAGAGYKVGLAYASYEWTAAVAMVLVALFLLPKFLRRGIFTIPEYLENRYSTGARGLMAFYMLAAYIFVIISAVLYAGAVWTEETFRLPFVAGIWVIGLIAGLYTVWGGLKAVVWADLFNGLGLILGGTLVTILGFMALGGGQGFFHGVGVFFQQAGDKLETVKPFNHREIPWVAVFIGGLWIPQMFYWGLNQFITQRALGAKSVAEGQKGVLFGATLKLLIPFIIIFPAIMAFQLFASDVPEPDKAYPHIARRILPIGLRGLMFATLFGAILSSLDSMLNSASTILTMDLYKRHFNREASERSLMWLGRWVTAAFVILACFWAPQLGWIAGDNGVFYYIQKTWGFITPGIVTVFFFGLFSKRTPGQAAIGAMLLGPAFYMWCLKVMPDVAFLHHMAFTFIALSIYMFLVTVLMPLREVEAAAAPSLAVKSERPVGLLGNLLIPFATAILGGYMFALALFQFSWITALQLQDRWQWESVPEWIHFATAGVPTAIYFVAALWLMRLPAPSIRLVRAAKAVRPARRLVRGLIARTAAVAAAIVVGLHVYMFSLWVLPEFPPENYWQGYDVNLSAVGTGEPVITKKVIEEEQFDPEPTAEPDQSAAVLPEPRAFSPPVEEPGLWTGGLTVYLTPLLIAIASVMAFLIGVEMLGRIPAAPEVEPEPTVKLDLTPSRWVPVWGAVVILATVLLYCFFF